MSSLPQRILVPTDFSDSADRARSLALQLAERFGSEIYLLHVVVLLDDPLLEGRHEQELLRMLESIDGERRQALEDLGAGQETPVVHSRLVRGVSAAEAILESCRVLDCDLVVMGTHGHRGLKHLLLGSVTEAVVRSCPVPVLTVRVQTDLSAGGATILAPHDFSPRSRAALRLAASWAEALGARITLLHAVEPVVLPELYAVDLMPQELMLRLEDRAQEALDQDAATYLAADASATLVRIGRAADTIVKEADEGAFDLVVMGTRGLSRLEHLLLGSVVERVLHRSTTSVLTVRGAE